MPQVKKLSVATVFGKIGLKELIKADETGPGAVAGADGKMSGGKMPLIRVIGAAVGTKTGNSSYGDWTALLGQFKAINLDTGEQSEAATLFLPDVALVPIQVALSGPDSRSVEFAIDIFATLRKDGKPGGVPYTFEWSPLLPSGANDPIRRLEEQIAALALPAPPPAADDKAEPAKGKGKGAK